MHFHVSYGSVQSDEILPRICSGLFYVLDYHLLLSCFSMLLEFHILLLCDIVCRGAVRPQFYLVEF